jgi:hypothetical protein
LQSARLRASIKNSRHGRAPTSRFITMTELLVGVLLGILYHVGDKHQPAAALLYKIPSQQPKGVGLRIFGFHLGSLLNLMELLLQVSDGR